MGASAGVMMAESTNPKKGILESLLEDDTRANELEAVQNHTRKASEINIKFPHFTNSPFEKYRLICKIGDRKLVKVYKAALLKNSNIEVAIKEINGKEIPKNTLLEMKHQINILTQLSHSSVLRLLAIYEPYGINSKFYITMECLRGGEIVNAIIRNNRYTEDDILFYASQLVSGVHFLHSKGIAHGNLIPENIVLSHANFEDRSQNHVKIVGFENAEWVTSRRFYNKKLSMDEFQSPELLEKLVEGLVNVKPTKEGDIWSVGKILQFLLSGILEDYSPRTSSSSKFYKSLADCFIRDPQLRITAYDLMSSFANCWSNQSIDLTENLESLKNYQMKQRISYSLKISSGVVNFYRANRYEEEKVFAVFQDPIHLIE
jgi:serine/threonine protein kinase